MEGQRRSAIATRASAFAAVLVVLSLACLARGASAAPDASSGTIERSYQLQHAFGGSEDWQDFGLLRTRVTGRKKSAIQAVKVAYEPLETSQRQALRAAVAADVHWRVRIATTPLLEKNAAGDVLFEESDRNSLSFVVTSLRASCLAAARFRDHFNFHFDPKDTARTLVSADHTARCGEVDGVPEDDIPGEIGPTTASVKFSKTAPSLTYVERKSKKGQQQRRGVHSNNFGDDWEDASNADDGDDDAFGSADEGEYYDDDDDDGAGGNGKKGPQKDERTWVQKNWMLLLAGGMMLINLMGSAMDPPQNARGGAQQQRRRGAPTR